MGQTTSVRFEKRVLEKADELAKREGVDRSTILRKATEVGLRELLLRHSLEAYSQGLVSAWKAADMAEIPLWRFIDELKERGIGFRTSEEDLKEMLEEYF